MERGFDGAFFSRFLALAGITLALAACGRPVTPLCTDTVDCDAGTTCTGGVCVAGGVGTCTTDLDCDPSNSEICQAGVCTVGSAEPNNSGGSCSATAECPTSQFCNTATGVCAALLEGWCRLDSQCTGDATLCSNKVQGEGVPGRCVECIDSADCAGGVACVAPGVCEEAAAGCPPNSSAQAGGTCRCDPGFRDDGAGNCNAIDGGEGEGEGEPAPGGEGEGEPPPAGGCTTMSECMESRGFDYTCDVPSGECVCDEAWMDINCNGDFDAVSCTCGGGGGPGPGPGPTPTSMANQECFEDADCDGLSCIFSVPSSGFLDPGYCKQTCSVDTDCGDGLSCMDDVFSDGSGICAIVGARAQTCEASIYQYDIGTDSLCDGGATGILDCFSSTCEEVCNWEGKTGPPEPCGGGTTCGALTFRAETGTDVAFCE